MRRLFFCVLLATVSCLPSAVSAQSSWRWTDISKKIGVRQNRPVWAVAEARGYLFITDGLAFVKGGKVKRLNGSSGTDLTRSLRDVGLTRVDDIVSDGKTVLFLKNVTARDTTFEVVSFNGKQFLNHTDRLRAWFDPDEGIASISGNGGKWLFVTTKGKVRVFPNLDNLRSRPEATSGVEPAVPVSDLSEDYRSDIGYSFRHTSPADNRAYLPVAAVPFGRGWLIAQRSVNTTFLVYNPLTGVEDVTEQIGKIERLQAIASNGRSVLIAGTNRADGMTDRLRLLTPTGMEDLSKSAAALPFSSWNRALIGWNGSSWMILSGKHLARFDGRKFQSLPKTKDYFLSLAGSSNGTFLLGGLVSSASRDEVPVRLTAKLVSVKEAR